MGNEVARVETETEDCTVVIFEDEDEENSTPKDTYLVTKLNAVEVTGVPKGQAIKVGVVFDTDEYGSQRFDLFRLRHLGTLTIQTLSKQNGVTRWTGGQLLNRNMKLCK